MRVTGGSLKRRLIPVPRGSVRPTTDRVRESLFAILAPKLNDASVLDLFAGSGALGLEALSRGAACVTWVEGDRNHYRALRRTVEHLSGMKGGNCVCSDVFRFLQRSIQAFDSWDIILVDPPYGQAERLQWREKILSILSSGPIVRSNGIVVFEQEAKQPVTTSPGWGLFKNKVFGNTRLLFYQRKPIDES